MLSTALLIVCATTAIYTATEQTLATSRNELQVQQLGGEIDRLDELRTISAWVAVTTGDDNWRSRYEEHLSQLGLVFEKLRQISPVVFDREYGDAASGASLRLAAAEDRIFELVQQGDSAAARAILGGEPIWQTRRPMPQATCNTLSRK